MYSLTFWAGANIFYDFLDFVAANICVYFSIYLCIWVCPNIFGAIVFTLGLRLMLY
jgi:hypothetical protein